MSETYREQHPLLCDEYSEEEQYGPDYPRRTKQRGWARNNVKGAAAIITRWPDHWSRALTYWWIGLSMIAVTIFIIYNGVIAFALLPPNNLKPGRPRTVNKVESLLSNPSTLPEVFMHVFVNSNDEVDFNNYLPHIEIIAEKHQSFNYNLIVVLNDTTSDSSLISAEENNQIAFKSLWNKEHIYGNPKTVKNNIKIKYTSLSKYFDESPLRNHWRDLPYNFIEFLIRAVSVWDKGGIAVNPIILTPRSPHVVYKEKLQTILQNYEKVNDKEPTKAKIKNPMFKDKQKNKKKVNNIRDIIDILEHEDSAYSNNFLDGNLSEAEDKENVVFAKNDRTLRSTSSKQKDDFIDTIHYSVINNKMQFSSKNNDTDQVEEKRHVERRNKHHDLQRTVIDDHNALQIQSVEVNDPSKFSLLPLFLEFLFHDKTRFHKHIPSENLTRRRKSVLPAEHSKQNTPVAENKTDVTNKTNSKDLINLKPMIISAKGIISDDIVEKELGGTLNKNDGRELTKKDKNNYNNDELTIDLRGNIIATKTACHAFIGTIFSDVVHRPTEESVKDFIIAELSYFCKGLLSSCMGIDVILL